MDVLEVTGLACGYGDTPVISDVSFSVTEGSIHVLLGPNGVGKTTLFKTVLGLLPPLEGTVALRGRDVRELSRRELARQIAYVPQAHDTAFGYSVREMVLMGRTPSMAGMLSVPSHADERAADDIIERLGLERLADRDVTELSGGERQMVFVARALVAEPGLIVMDEPCANLDFGNQALLLRRLLELRDRGISILMTSHDPNHAFALEADVTCLGREGLLASGAAERVLTAELLQRLYGIDVAMGRILSPSSAEITACAPVVMDCKAKSAKEGDSR